MSSPANVTAVVLCGGLGTRLRSVLPEGMPKCLALVAGRPFLFYILDHLFEQGVQSVVFCVGYGWEEVQKSVSGSDARGKAFPLRYVPQIDNWEFQYSHEKEPLGTAGALKKALPLLNSRHVLVLNGDTYCQVNVKDMLDSAFHWSSPLDAKNLMTVYGESGKAAGVWLFSLGLLTSLPLDVLQNILDNKGIVIPGVPYRRKGLKFHDIGTPEGYAGAEAFLREQGVIK